MWKSLDALHQEDALQSFVQNEFHAELPDAPDSEARRNFLRLMGASMALAGVSACTRQPAETIVPYVRAPEHEIPGKPLFYATASPSTGAGLVVEAHTGRPTKIEGNKEHPASLGATDAQSQADVLALYDPDRSQTVRHKGRISTWSSFVGAMRDVLADQDAKLGEGLRVLSPTILSPTLHRQMQELLSRYPKARWHQFQVGASDAALRGSELAFGQPVQPIFRFDRARIIVSLDADFLGNGNGKLAYARAFAVRRSPEKGPLNRLYVAEAMVSLTGAMADHRLRVRTADVRLLAHALATALGTPTDRTPQTELPQAARAWVARVLADLRRHAKESLIVAGEDQPAEVHAIVHALNQSLECVGNTVSYVERQEYAPAMQWQSLRELISAMNAEKVAALVVLGGNPAHQAPASFGAAYDKVPFRVHLSSHWDETSRRSHWHIPEAHFLEAWSDVRAFDGTCAIVQPLIQPLYNGKSAHEVVGVLLGNAEPKPYDLVQKTWAQLGNGAGWRTAVHDGVISNLGGTAFQPMAVSVREGWYSELREDDRGTSALGFELNLRPCPAIGDGRYANNAWLQELPRSITKLTWDNAVLLSPNEATKLGVQNGDVLRVTADKRLIEGPVWIVPGHADQSVTVHLGYGREHAGQVAKGHGFDAYPLYDAAQPLRVVLEATGRRVLLVSTQDHHTMDGREPVRVAEDLALQADEHAFKHHHDAADRLTLYPEVPYPGHAWGMSIDLNQCIGCNACTIACQAENNIAVVGKDEVANGREMHWIRVDHYHLGDEHDPQHFHQPVPCMHCENAPCEGVCPVTATAHSDEGLNDMVYNRCVGTRYCANNCPYKVRRFNFHLYSDFTTPSLKLQKNPDVTVRSRGVMEKCTYCVQRINEARITAHKDGRPIKDGEIVTACQAVCPTQAIIFGDINDKQSRVSIAKANPRNYKLLGELGTRPRTTYLGKLINPKSDVDHG